MVKESGADFFGSTPQLIKVSLNFVTIPTFCCCFVGWGWLIMDRWASRVLGKSLCACILKDPLMEWMGNTQS